MRKKLIVRFAALFAITVFLVGIPVSLAASNNTQTRKSIETYGNDAQLFAAAISSNTAWMRNNANTLTVIISSVDNNIANPKLENQKPYCTVFINLPAGNALYDAPNLSTVDSSVFYDANNQPVNRVNSAQTNYPTYWIAIIKEGNGGPGTIYNLMTSNNTSQVREAIWDAAVNIVTTNTANTVTKNAQALVSPLQVNQATWLQMYPLLYYRWYISTSDWLYSWHSINEANAYDSADAWEWWQVTSFIDQYLGDFVTNWFQDGPFVDHTIAQVNGASSSQVLISGPTSTATDTQIQYSIAAGFSQNGVQFSAGVSYTETNPGVGIACSGTANSETWRDNFNGPNYNYGLTWPIYTPAPSQDHNEWNTQTTVIYHTPLHSGFGAGTASDTWTINLDAPPQSLAMYLLGGWRTQHTYTINYNWNNVPSYFGKYANTVISGSTYAIGKGSVTNPSNLLGNYMDANYAQIYGGNSGDGGQITVQLNSGVSSGHVYIYGYSNTGGYISRITVSVSSNGNTWTQISDQYVSYTVGKGWIDCGSYSGSFGYVRIKGVDGSPKYYSINLMLDVLLVN